MEGYGAIQGLDPAVERAVAEGLLHAPGDELVESQVFEEVSLEGGGLLGELRLVVDAWSLVARGEELDQGLSRVEGVDARNALQVPEGQARTAVARRSGWQGVVQLVEVAHREPNQVRAEVLRVVVLSQNCVVPSVDHLDLDDDGLHAQVLQSDYQRKCGVCRCCRASCFARLRAALSSRL